jgi:hypothetical protein
MGCLLVANMGLQKTIVQGGKLASCISEAHFVTNNPTSPGDPSFRKNLESFAAYIPRSICRREKYIHIESPRFEGTWQSPGGGLSPDSCGTAPHGYAARSLC